MAQTPYFPSTDGGIATMLFAFDTNANANSGALAAKYTVTTAELNRVRQARYVWQWFLDTLDVGRVWAQSLTGKRDSMLTGAATGPVSVPGGPTLPASPLYTPLPAGTPVLAQLEPGFFEFFSGVVAKIKGNQIYDKADGVLLGIEGATMLPPDPAIIPILTGDLFTSGNPELTCRKGVFQGYIVWLTRPNMAKRMIGFSTGRRFTVNEPLPPSGTAEIWSFEVQYQYKGQPFGQVSQPLELTVRG